MYISIVVLKWQFALKVAAYGERSVRLRGSVVPDQLITDQLCLTCGKQLLIGWAVRRGGGKGVTLKCRKLDLVFSFLSGYYLSALRVVLVQSAI